MSVPSSILLPIFIVCVEHNERGIAIRVIGVHTQMIHRADTIIVYLLFDEIATAVEGERFQEVVVSNHVFHRMSRCRDIGVFMALDHIFWYPLPSYTFN